MLHPGDVIRETEFRKKEQSRALAWRQAHAVHRLGSRPRNKPDFRDIYYRQLSGLGRRTCALGLTVGCTLEARAAAGRRAEAR